MVSEPVNDERTGFREAFEQGVMNDDACHEIGGVREDKRLVLEPLSGVVVLEKSPAQPAAQPSDLVEGLPN